MAGVDVHIIITNEEEERLKNATSFPIIVSNEILYYFLLVNSWGPGQAVCIFGVITNVLNIITFVKQGVRDTVNISLLGLATSDLGSQITLMYANINGAPPFLAMDLPFVARDVIISAWITAYITLERCICVTVPLKVKQFFTPKRTVLYLQFVYLLMLASICPSLYTTRPAMIFDLLRNKTLLGVSFLANRDTIEQITFITNNTIPVIALCLVTVCTLVLVSSLRQKSKWRQNATSVSNKAAMSGRDNKVVKMVLLISVIFIISYVPSTAVFIYMLYDTDMRIDGRRTNLLLAAFSVLFNLESINAGVNIFIYLSMSSKFKSTFKATFCCIHN
ncbi:unnamed protein product [Candidula unifasciata]|uniref:G-protein coupled receptors family 1 profile domain-containing protein n=1 Tax=Candidula unifasciata TaxID=100452 RepID=A0A8S3YYL9_9EUPU|nr:unnamed protein product [Candidula unifasciata]